MTEAVRPIRVLILVWRVAKSLRGTIVGAVADHFPSGSVGNSTRNVFERTKGVAPVNSAGKNSRGSHDGWKNDVV